MRGGGAGSSAELAAGTAIEDVGRDTRPAAPIGARSPTMVGDPPIGTLGVRLNVPSFLLFGSGSY